MMPRIYKAIDEALASGMPPQTIGASLVAQGYNVDLVNQAVNAYMMAHGRMQQKTDFKTWLKKYQSKALSATIIIVFISLLSSSVLLLQPWPTKILVDSAFGTIPAPGPLAPYTHQPTLILITSLLTIGIFLLGVSFGTLRDYMVLRLGFWLNRDIKEETFRHILHLPLYHPQRLAKGDYIYRQNVLTNSLSDLVLDTTSSIAQSIIMVFGILIIMFTFNAPLTIISVVLVPFLFILIRVFGPRLGKISREMTVVASATSATITESVDNSETLQAFNLEEKQIHRADQLWRKNYELSKRALFWGRGYRFTNSLLIIMGTSSVMYFGGTAALAGAMTLGQLLIFMTYMGFLLGPIETIATEIAARNQKKVDVSRIYEVLTDHEGVENLRGDRPFPIQQGRIEFQNVSYRYHDLLVLKDINLTVEPGQKIGIIGPSGGGKSSFLKMVPLFLEPSGGRIMIDGIDIQSVSLEHLRRSVVWISQSPQLFNESVLENLLDGDLSRRISQKEVELAITAANVKEFTDRMPQGLNTPAGESGNMLSGGQKQRVAIARGLIKNAPIVCMDEPTAALDSKSENTIRDSISKLIDNKSVIMVTHRKALLSLMDTVYVMDNGQLYPVSKYGGLDSYLLKISDNETDSAREKAAAQAEQQNKEVLAQLKAQNEQLQEALNTVPQTPTQNPNDGTIYINH